MYLFVQQGPDTVLAVFTVGGGASRLRQGGCDVIVSTSFRFFGPPYGSHTESQFGYRNTACLLPARELSNLVEFRIIYFRG